MSDRVDAPISPVRPVAAVRPVHPVRAISEAKPRADIGAVTGGSLPAAYAQVVVNPDTHDVLIRVRHAATDQVLSEHSSSELEAVSASMKQYAAALARQRAAQGSASKA